MVVTGVMPGGLGLGGEFPSLRKRLVRGVPKAEGSRYEPDA